MKEQLTQESGEEKKCDPIPGGEGPPMEEGGGTEKHTQHRAED